MPHRFSGAAAGAYDAKRTPYLPEVVAALDLPTAPARVLDLAAGTGLLSRALLGAGHAVVAVEPDPNMAARQPTGSSACEVGRGDRVAVVLGRRRRGRRRMALVGHPGGSGRGPPGAAAARTPRPRVAVLGRRGATRRAGRLLQAPGRRPGEHPGFVGERGREALEAHPGFAGFLHRRVAFLHRTNRNGLIAEAASASFVNALEHREAFLGQLREAPRGRRDARRPLRRRRLADDAPPRLSPVVGSVETDFRAAGVKPSSAPLTAAEANEDRRRQ